MVERELELTRAIGVHHAAMPETFNSSLDEARLRAADYRMRAEELRMRAASIEWDEAKAEHPQGRGDV